MRAKQTDENKETDLDTSDIMGMFDFDDDMWVILNNENRQSCNNFKIKLRLS